jgi:NADP-dependent 3-hydroxy acid dehydrogenase YdfG
VIPDLVELPPRCLLEKAQMSPSVTYPRRRKSKLILCTTSKRKLTTSAKRVKEAIEKDGQKCMTLALDIMDPKNCEKLVSKHIGEHGQLDILVNNASKQIMEESITEINVSSASPSA